MIFAHLFLQINQVQVPDSLAQRVEGQGAAQEGLSAFDLLVKGGLVMIPILILSLLAIYLFVERYLYIKQASKLDDNFLSTIKEKLYAGDVKAASDFCHISKYPVARLIEKGLSRLGSPIRDVESAIENTARVEIYKMEKNVPILAAVATIAPMFGFLGTVVGMIQAFYNISIQDNISIGVISSGIYTKMVTSASGLIVGVIAYIFYTYLNTMIDRVAHKMEVVAIEFLDILHKPVS